MIRCLTTIETCLALLMAFVVAPFQHVHPGSDHDHGATIHAHFYRIGPRSDCRAGLQLQNTDDDDDHDAVWSVDSFTLVLPPALAPFIPARALMQLFRPVVPVAWVDVVEECGHDPPETPGLIPRAPPS